MDWPIPMHCPGCGSRKFKAIAEPQLTNDFKGAICARCQRVISETDIETHLKKCANDVMRTLAQKFKRL
jgi:hypothetical protein